MKRVLQATACVALIAATGCTYYVPAAPGYSATVPASFDRSFAAAAGAMRDQGLTITEEDPIGGTVAGRRDGSSVVATVSRQGDGSVRVQFDSRDVRDPGLLDRISQSYDRRMGR